jgi:hypothetical protein
MNAENFSAELDASVAAMSTVSLSDLDQIKLLNRIDTKYIFHVHQLPALLNALAADYPLLEIDGKRIFRYDNEYFDTTDFTLYHMHHRGMANRFKARIRTYSDSGLQFFEVKYKTSSNRTLKQRSLLADSSKLPEEIQGISWGRQQPKMLKSVMNISFRRITLAGFQPPERITLDLDLCFRNLSRELSFPDLVVAELKQDKSSGQSIFLQQLRKFHLEEIGFSKYAMSVALLEKVKYNNFKPVILKLNRILKSAQEIKPALMAI